jgi:fructose-bisphosphate aldolase class I
LKSNIINPGKDCSTSYTLDEIAKANVAVLETTVPVAIKTANYLSGGQTLGQAAARLAAINRHNKRGPWNLSFSWSAALQLPLLNLCKGKGELQLDAMSEMYIEELKIASAASIGDWNGGKDGDHVGKRKRKLSP